jgi:ferredoxin
MSIKDEGLIITDETKCQGCNKCIRHCPIDANIAYLADKENVKVRVNKERCINCGKCLEVCDHDARDYIDDTEVFFRDLKQGSKITVLAAPALKTNFRDYKKLFAYLKSLGVESVYDVSFGADITTWAYLKVIREQNLNSLIAQPCPAIVSYVEKNKPEIIDKLSPIHSPLMCAAIYLRKYLKNQNTFAFLSPCIAKKQEIEEVGGIISYNVTFKKLSAHLEEQGVDLGSYSETDFDPLPTSLGFLYSRPGGLRENIEALIPNPWIRQIEGTELVYEYLDTYGARVEENKPVPLVIDALNCTYGCNVGSAACLSPSAVDDIDYLFNKMKEKTIQKNTKGYLKKRFESIGERFERELNVQDFIREYNYSRAVAPNKIPPEDVREDIYEKLYKNDDSSRSINCTACGCHTCDDMVVHIYNDINVLENCMDYTRRKVLAETMKNTEINAMLKEIEKLSNERLQRANNLKENANAIKLSLEELATANEGSASTLMDISNNAERTVQTARQLKESVDQMEIKLNNFAEASRKLSILPIRLISYP